MSVRVDDTRPYTEEEKEYLLTRASGEDLIKINDRKFAHLSKKEKAELQKQAQKDEEGEAKIQAELQRQQEEAESDSYHPDDIAQVNGLTIKDLRQRLEKEGLRTTVTAEDKDPSDPDDPDGDDDQDPFTEKEVLAYRLLNFLDERRKAQPPAKQ